MHNFLPDQNNPISKSAIARTSVREIEPAVAGHNFNMCLTKADGVACGIIWNPIFSNSRLSKSTSWSLWKCGKFDCRRVIMESKWLECIRCIIDWWAWKWVSRCSLTVQSGLISCIFVASITAEAAARLIICASVGDSGSHRDWKSNCVKKLSKIWILKSLVSTEEFDNKITYRRFVRRKVGEIVCWCLAAPLHVEAKHSFVALTFRIHLIVEALISIIPVGIMLLSFKTSCLFPLMVSRLILIRLSIIGDDSMLQCFIVITSMSSSGCLVLKLKATHLWKTRRPFQVESFQGDETLKKFEGQIPNYFDFCSYFFLNFRPFWAPFSVISFQLPTTTSGFEFLVFGVFFFFHFLKWRNCQLSGFP